MHGALCPQFFCQMVRHYKKKTEGGRTNYLESQVMVDVYNSVMKKEMSANQAAKCIGVSKKVPSEEG